MLICAVAVDITKHTPFFRFYCTDELLPNIPIEKKCDLQEVYIAYIDNPYMVVTVSRQHR